MKNKYTSPLFQIVETQPQEYCADLLSDLNPNSDGKFGENSDSIRDTDYE